MQSLDETLRQEIMNKLTVDLWPTAGRALGLGRGAAYEAARTGKIVTIDVGCRKKPVPTAWLRRVLGIDDKAAT